MISRIHIVGASGSGTTTLAKALSKELGYTFFDSDDYFWEPTEPPYELKREVKARKQLLKNSLESKEKWILSGSLCGWGDEFIPYFDLVIYLWIPQDIRIRRLIARERERYGEAVEVGGSLYEKSIKFIEWASQYDGGDGTVRSRALHEAWLEGIKCPILRIEGAVELEDKLKQVKLLMQGETNI